MPMPSPARLLHSRPLLARFLFSPCPAVFANGRCNGSAIAAFPLLVAFFFFLILQCGDNRGDPGVNLFNFFFCVCAVAVSVFQ